LCAIDKDSEVWIPGYFIFRTDFCTADGVAGRIGNMDRATTGTFPTVANWVPTRCVQSNIVSLDEVVMAVGSPEINSVPIISGYDIAFTRNHIPDLRIHTIKQVQTNLLVNYAAVVMG